MMIDKTVDSNGYLSDSKHLEKLFLSNNIALQDELGKIQACL